MVLPRKANKKNMAANAVPTGVLVVMVAVAVLVGSASAQSASGCRQAVISLSPCINYITGNETAPSGRGKSLIFRFHLW
jgi:hypothetical protein